MLKVDEPFKTGGIIVICHSKEESLQFIDEVLDRYDISNLGAWHDPEKNKEFFEKQFSKHHQLYMLLYIEGEEIWTGWESDRDWLEETEPYRRYIFLEFSEAFGTNVDLGEITPSDICISNLFL